MVGGRRKKDRRSGRLMGNHQRAWLRGRHAVIETLRGGRWVPHELVVSDQFAAADARLVEDLAETLHVDLVVESHDRLTELCHARDHQGIIARMPEYPYESAQDVIGQASSVPLFVILECVQDPFNLGSILRSAGVFGVDGVFIGSHGQVDVNCQVARSSVGAVNRLAISRVDSLSMLLQQLKDAGVRILATSPHGESRIDEVDCISSLAVVIGNEGAGVSEELLQCCDQLVTIPQATDFESLNAAVSAGIVLYEVHRQRC